MVKNNKSVLTIVGITVLVVAASFVTSSHPDGLEFVAQKLGFLGKATTPNAILADYSVKAIGESPQSTAIAGLIGAAVCSGLIAGIAFFSKREKE